MIREDYITIEQPKEILPYIINANSHRGIILSLLSKFRRDAETGYTYSALELKQVFEEALTKYNELKKDNEKDNVIYALVGWKGQDFPEIFNDGEEFLLEEHRKSKDGEVEVLTHKVPYKNVDRVLKIVKTLKINESMSCYDIALKLGFIEWKDLWRERKTYFEVYYYPIKVIESMLIIKYSSKGKTTRLK